VRHGSNSAIWFPAQVQYRADVSTAEEPSTLPHPQSLDPTLDHVFDGLLDDAAMFPPGNADAASAISEHLRYRAGEMNRFVGPLLIHVDRWGEVAAAHLAAGSPELNVIVLGTTSLPGSVPELRVAGFELPVRSLPLPLASEGLSVACEVQADDAGVEVMQAAASAGEGNYVVKFRTGGTTPEAFPDEAALAHVVASGIRAGAPMKFTAGLHHAVRFRDETTGFEHHGFLNLLVAVHAALAGASESDLAAILGQRTGHDVAAEVRSWQADEVAAVRRAFVSFGCCGVEDPISDLIELGLVAPEVRR
jgi:hypothetical protein